MPSLSQSPLLQALGYAIAHSLWQMAIVWIVYVLLNGLFKFKSENKYRIAVAAQVVGFTWFLGTLQFYYAQSNAALQIAESVYLEGGDQSTTIVAPESLLLRTFIRAEQVLPYLSMAYLALLAVLTFRWFNAYRYTQLVRSNGLQKIDVDWKLFVNKVAAQLGIKRKVSIYLSELVKSPVTIGFFKPLILIPVASINHLTPEQMEAVILHELAHIRRHDYLLNIVLSVIDLALFFNPFTRLISKSVARERENSCDDWVLQYQYAPAIYAEALIRIAVLQRTPALAMYAAKTKTELVSRIDRMVNQKDTRFNYRHQLLALLLMTGILGSIAWYDPNAIKAQESKPMAEKRAVVIEPLAARIDNPLFNPVFFLNEPIKAEVKKNVAATERQIRKLQQSNELAVRDIQLPEVMAPVAIQNLKALEQNINSTVNRQMRRVWTSGVPANGVWMPRIAAPEAVQVPTFHFDSLQFNWPGSIAIAPEINMQSLQDQLEASTRSVQDALRKKQISESEAKKMQAEITAAFARLKHVRLAQLPGFAFTTTTPEDVDDDENETVAADQKRAAERKSTHKLFDIQQHRILFDSLRRQQKVRLVNGNGSPLQAGKTYAYAPGTFQEFSKDSLLTKAYGFGNATVAQSDDGNVVVYSYAQPRQRSAVAAGQQAHRKPHPPVPVVAPGCTIIKTDKKGKVLEITVMPPSKPTPPAEAPGEEIDND